MRRPDLQRCFDTSCSLVLGACALPVLAVLAGLIRLRMGSPVLFRQARAGRNGTPFQMVKLRTMTDDRGSDGELLADDQRLTTLGQWLRRTSLDEVPELWNVLRGDMAIVGPRPLPVRYLVRYDETQRRRHEVRPGLTGWAQVHGRNDTTWAERLAFDVWYVENRNAWLDLQILARTVRLVLGGRGVDGRGAATMSEFEHRGEEP